MIATIFLMRRNPNFADDVSNPIFSSTKTEIHIHCFLFVSKSKENSLSKANYLTNIHNVTFQLLSRMD